MQQLNYTCPKCGNVEFETSELRATGGYLSKLFDPDKSGLGNIFDLFAGG